ncbi:MAG: CPBP family intramembrane metalloprotease [Deltaproteobacteria bacterium]|nr:CPBP family intramembrane metalloprotease [Deltaproteobacteria bacterium]
MGRRRQVNGPLGQEGPDALEAFAVLLVWVVVDGAVQNLPGFRMAREQSTPLYYSLLAVLRVLEALGLLAYWRLRGWSAAALGFRGERSARGAAFGVGLALGLGALVTVLEVGARLAFHGSFLRLVAGTPTPAAHLGVLLVVGGLIAPVFEELLFRGILYGGLRKRAGIFFSTTVASLIFASAHYNFRAVHPVQAAGAVLFCAAYELSGSLWAPLIVHVTGNLALFLAPSLLRLTE